MKDDRSDRVQEAHNQGQKDGATGGSYESPHGVCSTIVTAFLCSKEETDTCEAENKAYDDGYRNADKQK